MEVDLTTVICRFYFYKHLLLLIDMVHCLCVSACGKSFASIRKLYNHEQKCKTCTRMARYRCDKCSKMFSTVKILKEHGLVHSDVRKFKCHLCDRTFKSNSSCNRHVKEHSDVRNFQCHVCDRRFHQKSSCNRHVEGHFGIKNFQCTVCDRSFAHYQNAHRHEEICRQKDVYVSDSYSDNGLSDLTDNEEKDDVQT